MLFQKLRLTFPLDSFLVLINFLFSVIVVDEQGTRPRGSTRR